jgi:nucleoside-diphosphate kinase
LAEQAQALAEKQEKKEKKKGGKSVSMAASDPIPAGQKERTFIMVKPDGMQRGLLGKIVAQFEKRGFKMAAMKVCQPGKAHLEQHYADLAKKPFFPALIEYMTSGPVCAMIWEGDNVVLTGRKMLGATKPIDSNSGTIRGDNCVDVGRNICHGSDSVESAT